jgi:hypothetical protein
MQIPSAIAAIAPDGKLSPRQRRRFLIEMCKRRIRPGTGSASEFLRRRTAMNPWPDLRSVLKDIPWVIVGGVATRAYMPERATQDMDVLIRQEDEQVALSCLKTAGYGVISRLAISGWLVRSPEGVEVDVLLGDYVWLSEALARPRLDPAGYPVIDLPYLVLMKMQARPFASFLRSQGKLCGRLLCYLVALLNTPRTISATSSGRPAVASSPRRPSSTRCKPSPSAA